MARLSNKRWLKCWSVQDRATVYLIYNIVNGHKPCCAKALSKLVSVSYSEEIFSFSRWIMEDLVDSLEDFCHSPTSTFTSGLKSIMYCVKTTWTNVNQLMLLIFLPLSLDHFQKFYVYIRAVHPTWINLFASTTFNDSLKFFLRSFEIVNQDI